MRQVLVLAALLASAGLTAWNRPEAAAQDPGVGVTAYLYQPTGDSYYPAVMTCGWHVYCDGNFSDVDRGLDWKWANNVEWEVWVRIKAYGGTSPQLVATGSATNSISGCKQIWYDMYRHTTGEHIGRVRNQHSRLTYAPVYLNLNASSSGNNNSGYVGAMLQTGDNCPTTGPHTMDWYTQGSAGSALGRNVNIHAENDCWDDNCAQVFGYFQTYEYTWSFFK